MVKRRGRTTLRSLLVAGLVCCAGVARAQDKDSPLDRELEESLRKAHEQPRRDPPPRDERPYRTEEPTPRPDDRPYRTERPPVDEPPPPIDRRWRETPPGRDLEPRESGGTVAFPSPEKKGPHGGLLPAIWPAQLSGVRVGSKKGGLEGGNFPLTVAGGSNHVEACYFTRASFSLGPFSLEAAYRGGSWGGKEGADRPIVYGGVAFAQGTPLKTRFDMRIVDLDAAVNLARFEVLTLSTSVGFRYAYSFVQMRGGGFGQAAQGNEGFMPMFGFAASAKIPVADVFSIELFTRNRIGGWSYGHKEKHEHGGPSTFLGIPTGGGGPRVRWTHFERWNSYSTESEAGIKLVFFDTVALGTGYRMDLVQLDFESNGDRKRTYWLQHGPVVSASVQF